jgi:hypothetical protein
MASAATMPPPFQIDANFPGGNVVVEQIDGDAVDLRPDLRDTAGGWFYWCFRVRGAAGRTLTVRFTAERPIGVRGPGVSIDGGATWRWLGADEVGHDIERFTFAVPAGVGSVMFSMAMLYTRAHWDRFAATPAVSVTLRQRVLCRSRDGRAVTLAEWARVPAAARAFVLVTARHHACEMTASHVLEGLLAEAAGAGGAWLREHVDLAAVPFVDADGVERGDQGKNRRPHDHNRDYRGASIYPEVAAIRALVPARAAWRPIVHLDLHCPYIRGPLNEAVYQVGSRHPAIWAQQQRFATALAATDDGNGLPYDPADDLPFGQAWNVGDNFSGGVASTEWSAAQPGATLVSGIEIPYANARRAAVTAEAAHALGRRMARALTAFLAAPDIV